MKDEENGTPQKRLELSQGIGGIWGMEKGTIEII